MAPKRCLVCGAAHAICGPKTDTTAIDERVRSRTKMGTEKKRYPNPAHGPSAFLLLTDEGAERLGLDPKDGEPHRRPGPAPIDVTNEGGAALVSSETAATGGAPDEAKPDGALAPGGPTSRARRAAAAEAPQEPGPAAVEGTDPEGAAVEPGEVDPEGEPEGDEPKAARRRRASS